MTNNEKYRVHLLGFAHIPTRKEFSVCAYTQKALKLSSMLMSMGHEVIFYGAEGSEVECTEFVQVLDEKTRVETYGEYDISKEFFKREFGDIPHAVFNSNATKEILKRKKDGDFLFVTMGIDQQPIAKAVDIPRTIECGIGYTGIFAPYKVFESYAWMNWLYGKNNLLDINWFDTVIPNYWDPDDFEFREKKGDYFLYIGRIILRKGVEVARQVAKEMGVKLVIAGQRGDPSIDISDCEYVGMAGPEQRKELMAGAKAVFVPTVYFEPFGGVSIEAAFSGTPVICTDFGAFPENILDGITGYRARNFGEALWAAQNVDKLDPHKIRKWAEENFSMDRVRWLYQAYMDQIATLDDPDKAWFTRDHKGVSEYQRYRRFYP